MSLHADAGVQRAVADYGAEPHEAGTDLLAKPWAQELVALMAATSAVMFSSALAVVLYLT